MWGGKHYLVKQVEAYAVKEAGDWIVCRDGNNKVFLKGGAGDMRFTYDPKYNIAYLKFREKSAEVHTLKVSDELNIDLASDGTIYGIELLNANEQIYRQDEGKFLLINEVTGEKVELSINR
jgi:uncharacterized protein YuzE